MYRKSSTVKLLNLDTKNYRNYPKNEAGQFYDAVMHPEDADGLANSVYSDQTASYLGLHCLLMAVCPNTKNFYSTCIHI